MRPTSFARRTGQTVPEECRKVLAVTDDNSCDRLLKVKSLSYAGVSLSSYNLTEQILTISLLFSFGRAH